MRFDTTPGGSSSPAVGPRVRCRSAVLTVLILLAAGWAGGAASEAAKDVEVARHTYIMGTRATFVTFAADRARGLDELETMLQVVEDVEGELSTWRAGTPLSHVNAQPLSAWTSVAPSLCHLLVELQFWQRETAGAFDPAVGTLISAWGLRSRTPRVPTRQALAAARDGSGLAHLRVDAQTCQVRRDREIVLDAGAFGKGAALDRVARHREDSPRPWLIDLGGQVMVSGNPPGLDGWSVDLAHPQARYRSVVSLRLDHGSLATTGGSERNVSAGHRRIGHVIDPRTGETVTFPGSVTVWHRRGLVADILSTALFVMGPDAGLAWAEERDVAACFLVPRDSKRSGEALHIRASPAFVRQFDLDGPHRETLPATARHDHATTGHLPWRVRTISVQPTLDTREVPWLRGADASGSEGPGARASRP